MHSVTATIGTTRTALQRTGFYVAVGAAVGYIIFEAGTANSYPERLAWANLLLIVSMLALVRMSTGRFVLTHPLTWMAAALAIMYVAHPLAYIASGGFDEVYHGKLLTEPGYGPAMELAFIASIGVLTGWVGSQMVEPTTRLEPTPEATLPYHRSRRVGMLALSVSWYLIGFAVIAFLAFSLTTGQNPIDSLLNGARRGANVNSSAYLYLAPQVIGPATLIRAYANFALERSQLSVVVLAACQSIIYIPTGQRLVLLLTLVPTVMFVAYIYRWRVGILGGVVLIFASFTVLVVLRDAGSANGTTLLQSAERALSNPSEGLREFFAGPDTEMIDGLAIEVQRVPSEIAHDFGRIVESTIAAPIPSVLWPGKPVTADSILNQQILGTQRNFASVAYGFAGELFFDSGAFGVFFGFALFAVLISALWRYRCRRGNDPISMLLYFALLPFIVVQIRGSLALTLGRSLFIIGPILLLIWLANETRNKPKRLKKAGL